MVTPKIPKVSARRWNAKSDDAKEIESMFADGRLGPSSQPAEVLNQYFSDGGYKLASFRGGFNRLKTKLSVNVRTTEAKGEFDCCFDNCMVPVGVTNYFLYDR
jgi:hypothetical protein